MKKLNLPKIHQKRSAYSIPNSIKAIIQFFDSRKDINEDAIFQDLGGDLNNTLWGRFIGNSIAKYLDNETNKEYQSVNVYEGFGEQDGEKDAFQEYILTNIDNNTPVLFIFSFKNHIDGNEYTHSIVINGIKVDEKDFRNTIYFYTDGIKEDSFTGNEIITYSLFGGIDLIGELIFEIAEVVESTKL